jgi:surfactin synthase thioesterase subunit
MENEFIMVLLHAVSNSHIIHWQALTRKNYPEHVILGDFYPDLQDLVDDLMENMIGGYKVGTQFPTMYYAPSANGIVELEALQTYVKTNRTKLPQESEIQNLIDEIAARINKSLALLRSSP